MRLSGNTLTLSWLVLGLWGCATSAGLDDDDTAEVVIDVAEPQPYSNGTCPAIEAGTMSFATGSDTRGAVIVMPQNPEGAGLLFLWHGNGDTPANFSAASATADSSAVL